MELSTDEDEEISNKDQIEIHMIESAIPAEFLGEFIKRVEHFRHKGFSRLSSTRKAAVQIADASELPTNVFMHLEDDQDDDTEGDEDFPSEMFTDYYSDMEYDDDIHTKPHGLASSTHCDRIGGGLEIWPVHRLRAILLEGERQIHNEFPNFLEIENHESFQKTLGKCPVHTFPDLRPDLFEAIIHGHLPKHPDAVILDPPIQEKRMSVDDLVTIFQAFCKPKTCTFIFIWSDPENFGMCYAAAEATSLLFCDSVAVELFDAKMEPFVLNKRSEMPRTTRMIMVYKTADVSQEKLAQQRTKDIGFGIARPCGKSHRRPGMPQVPHHIIEQLLPCSPHEQKVFCEFWPTRMAPRINWYAFDEMA